MAKLTINGRSVSLEVADDMPLLWAIRDYIGLSGTKFGCGAGLCGACAVHVDGEATRSCITPIASVDGSEVVTIEGLSSGGDHPVQLAWVAEDAPQCGYCQSGQIMQAAALLADNPDPSDEEIDTAMKGNLCRCGTYNQIRAAIKHAARTNMAGNDGEEVSA